MVFIQMQENANAKKDIMNKMNIRRLAKNVIILAKNVLIIQSLAATNVQIKTIEY